MYGFDAIKAVSDDEKNALRRRKKNRWDLMARKRREEVEMEDAVDKLKDGFVEVQRAASDLRKKEKDTNVIDVMLLEMPAKMRMIQVTMKKVDVESARKTIESIKKEVTNENKDN